jgi:hypothetical protein
MEFNKRIKGELLCGFSHQGILRSLITQID